MIGALPYPAMTLVMTPLITPLTKPLHSELTNQPAEPIDTRDALVRELRPELYEEDVEPLW